MGAIFLFAVMILAVLMGNALPAQAYRYTDPYVLHGEYRENGELWLTHGDVSALGYPLGDETIILPGQHYRRLNLEDGEGMDAARAGKIRAVILAVQDLQALGRAAGADSPMNLTEEEAVTAAREAIRSHISGDAPDGDSSALNRYLCALPPMVPDTLAVSDSSLHIRSAAAQLQPDGTYRAEVEFTTTTTCCPGDELTVTVFCGELQKSFLLTERNVEEVHRVAFSCDECPAEIRVEINGYQQGSGVFLFLPVEGNNPLAGWDDRVLPVHAEVTAFVAGEEDTFVCVPASEGELWRYTVTVEQERGLYLIWWIALIVGLLAGTAVAAALLLRFRRK